MDKRQNLEAEQDYQKGLAADLQDIQPTPQTTFERYKNHFRPSLYYKERMFALVEQCRPKTVCDFGCGAGETSTELAQLGCEVTGIDVSPELIGLCQRRAALDKVSDRCTFLLADVASPELSRQAGTFDLVFVQAVLHHLANVTAGLASIRNLLKPGGHVVLQEPVALSKCLQFFLNLMPAKRDLSPNERQLDRRDLAQFREYFELVETHYFHGLSRLYRVLPEGRLCRRLDAWLFRALPCFRRFAGIVVMLLRKPAAKEVP